MKRRSQRSLIKSLPLLSGICISLLLVWFALHSYRLSTRLAEENLRGLALSLSSAVETLAARDPGFELLRDFQTRDMAYFMVIAPDGRTLFHVNRALVGTMVLDRRYRPVFDRGEFVGQRVRLGTGETVYESHFPLHINGTTRALRLALHTYRADSVIRMARIGLLVVLILVSSAWGMGLLLYRYAGREAAHRKEMQRRRELARLGEMGAVIAHEIRNPLAGIKGYAQLLEEKLQNDEDGQFAETIVNEAIRLEEIVNGLLAYTQGEAREFVAVDINQLVTRTLALITPEAEASGVTHRLALERRVSITGNPDRLEQMLLNLFRNAIQAMPGGGVLSIGARIHGSRLELCIADSGQGIEAGDLERIFEPFFTTRSRGSGLGLAICRKIAEEHRGSIMAGNLPGGGAAFTISLPIPRTSDKTEERR